MEAAICDALGRFQDFELGGPEVGVSPSNGKFVSLLLKDSMVMFKHEDGEI